MGWISLTAAKTARHFRMFLLVAGLAPVASIAHAQAANMYAEIQNQYLVLGIGNVAATDGSVFLQTAPGNPTNPTPGMPVTLLFGSGVETTNNATVSTGSVVYVRVDGGKSAGGNDYIFGRQTEGTWLAPPAVAGNHIVARWQTASQVVNNNTVDPRIEVDLIASFVHDQARFQFSIKNNSPGRTHSVSIAFLQDIVVGKEDEELGGPIRLPNGPYLRHETLLQGNQVPSFFDVFALGTIAPSTNIPGGPSLRGNLGPINRQVAGQAEPTLPTRFGYGDLNKLSGVGNPIPNPIFTGRDFDFVWNFKPDPSVDLTGGTVDNAVIDYWDGQAVGAGQTVQLVTYIGQASSTTDFNKFVTLGVTAPLALGYTTNKDSNGNPIGVTATPSPFVITANVQNQTDLTNSASIPITYSPVTLFLDLPKGLMLAPGEANPKTILNLMPGQEAAAAWQVVLDPAHPANGKLAYTVTSSPNGDTGKSVQRTVEVPVPAVFNLPGTNTTQGLYRMVSFPLIFGNTTPSVILGLNANQPAPDFDLVRWNPIQGHYEPVNTFLPGFAYWLRSRLTTDKTIIVDTLKYPPLEGQVQPTAAPYKVDYPKGWNQIGTPDIYDVRFSEIQVFDPASKQIVDVVTASDPLHQWILPAVFFYDTSDPNPQNWKYVLEDNFGFDMVPYQGYWIFNKLPNLEFFYPGVDTLGASVTRSALVGVGLTKAGSRAASTDWYLALQAKGKISTDYSTVIGVTGKATDALDYYKVSKPPIQENQLTLDIVHDNWSGGGRFAKDLRSPSSSRKTWDMVLTSSRPNEPVILSWPGLGVSVPRSYRLTLIDKDSNARYDMRSTSSVAITTNANKTRNVQVIAEPTRGSGPALITSFDVATQPGAPGGRAVASVSINYTLSQQADTQIQILSSNGRVLRTLTGQPLAGSGANTGRAVFDMRDSQGRLISTGVYTAVLKAQGADGQVSRQVRPFILPR